MQYFTLITADILFLFLIIVGVLVERRVSKLEFEHTETACRDESAYFDFAFELDALKKRLGSIEERENLGGGQGKSEKTRAEEAEKLFSEGVANILGYDMRKTDACVSSRTERPNASED